ncbi:MAG: Jag protein [Candidatus Magasanikbacteria bacterium GW2011_GWA2_46_17]|uniref:Jag protein n=1 Tax=Candidatus Magasanikbacteria bacterium GW2011_GWA2_46_17 TaxID=1619042 RepID=A0A0G1R941_9BACT|nr:MAG: Jag protein [Candidatus Magasanikbacteria bacterium GW2011_GWA2_46_17]
MDHTKTKKIIEDTLKFMGVSFQTVEKVDSADSKHDRFMIRTEESALLIGSKGENLGALNYIVKRIVSKTLPPESEAKFFIDVNEYHEKALESVKAKAKIMSERARSFKSDVELEPMSSYERMLIHSFLEGAPDIKTESRGEGATRRVVIKYVQQTNN